MQKKFVDAVNGKSGLTYFDALESEVSATVVYLDWSSANGVAEQKLDCYREHLSGGSSGPNSTQSAVLDGFTC